MKRENDSGHGENPASAPAQRPLDAFFLMDPPERPNHERGGPEELHIYSKVPALTKTLRNECT